LSAFSIRHPFNVRDFWLLVIGIPILTLAISILFFAGSIGEGWLCYRQNLLSATISTSIFWMGNRQLVFFFRKRFRNPADNDRRLYFTILSVFVFTIATVLIMAGLEEMAPPGEPNIYRDSPVGKKMGAVLFATVTVLSIYEALFYFRQWKDSLQASERLKKEHTMSQLEALRNQVNPHFLFNSLNTLTSLIPEDPGRAVAFVQELSNVYRNILEQKEKKVITLEEELSHLQSYLFLAGERFGESLHIDIRIAPDHRQLYLVPLSLQMLAENAIKHNIVSRRKPLHIEIHSGPETITVRNTLQPKSGPQEGTGTGLRNIRERFRLTFGKDIDVNANESNFTVVLPLVSIDQV
jgi:two-component system, LytTR family, sensor kinase